jgi:hypothetical protein
LDVEQTEQQLYFEFQEINTMIKSFPNMMLSSSTKKKNLTIENGTRKIVHAVLSPFFPKSPSIFTPAALYTNDKFRSTKIRN